MFYFEIRVSRLLKTLKKSCGGMTESVANNSLIILAKKKERLYILNNFRALIAVYKCIYLRVEKPFEARLRDRI